MINIDFSGDTIVLCVQFLNFKYHVNGHVESLLPTETSQASAQYSTYSSAITSKLP